jgi:transposase
MDRDALAGLVREELLEVAVRQQQEVIERQRELIAGLEQQAALQAARIAELEAELARLGQPPKTPGTSSVPPSAGFKANRAERRARKRRAGHDGISRRRQAPDVVVRCRPERCDGCGAALSGAGQRRVGRSQVVELPPLRPVVVEAWRYAARCRACGARTVAAAPTGLEPGRTFGPTIEALVAYLHERHHLGYARLVEVCRDVLGLAVSEGAVAGMLARLAERARPTYDAIGAEVRAGPVVHSDETSARVNRRNGWQWVFGTPDASYHVLAPSRGGDVIDAFLGDAVPEVWCSDLWAPQVGAPADRRQVCLGHQLRDLTYAVEADAGDERAWADAVRHVFGRAIRLHHERAQVDPASFARRRTLIERATDRLVFGPPLAAKTEARRLQQRYRTHRAGLYVFLHRDDVEPTNNAAERDLRNSVIHRKVTGGHRSRWGAEASAIVTTLLATARKRGQNAYAALRAIAGPSPLQATGTAT